MPLLALLAQHDPEEKPLLGLGKQGFRPEGAKTHCSQIPGEAPTG